MMKTKLGPFTVVQTDPSNKNNYTPQTRGKMYAYHGDYHSDYHDEYLQRDGVLRSSCSEPNYPLYGWFSSIEEVHAAYKIYVMEQIIAKYRKDLSENGQAVLENPYITFAKDISSEATIKTTPSQEYRPDATDIEVNRLQQENWAAKAAYRKSIEALTEEQRKALTEGSWDMSSDDMLDYADSDFGPDKAHVDPHQADHEPTNKTADITQNFISQSSQSSGKPFYGCSDDDNPKPTI